MSGRADFQMANPQYTTTDCRECGHRHLVKDFGGACRWDWCTCEKWSRKAPEVNGTGNVNGNQGRPYKFTRDKQAEYCEKLKSGIPRLKAAVEIGIDIKTVEREIAKGNGFILERDNAETYATDDVEESLHSAAISGNVPAAVKWLEVKRSDVWAPKRDPIPGSSPATPLYVAPGQIDWDAIPEDLAERFLAINAEIVALQPSSGGLVINQEGERVE